MTTLKTMIALLGCVTLLGTAVSPSMAQKKDEVTGTAQAEEPLPEAMSEEAEATPEAEPLPGPVEFYNSGVRRFNDGSYEDAIADFNEAIRQRPDYAEAFMFRGAAYSRLETWDQAIASFNQAIILDPTFARAYLLRATAYYELGNTQQALADIQEAVIHDPTLVEAYLYQGFADAQRGNTEAAIINLTEAIRLNPDDLNAYILRGFAYDRAGDFQAAINDFTYVIQNTRASAIAHWGGGRPTTTKAI
jgi:tetratricopeptide (TPR) repeat protein